MIAPTMGVPVLKPGRTYSGDNGRMFCTDHAGAEATFTGRDISGRRVRRITNADEAAIRAITGLVGPLCETCRARAKAAS